MMRVAARAVARKALRCIFGYRIGSPPYAVAWILGGLLMRAILMLIVCAVMLWAGPETKRGKHPTSRSEAAQQEITGCLDQRGESYVLKSEKDMKEVTALKGKAFSDDNFARYVGHTVTVYGSKDRDLFQVMKIVNVADTCAR
jgi:hypothetical protein